MDDLLLGIDVGTTAAKVALVGQNGRVETVHRASYRMDYLKPGWVEQHPEHWWDAVCTAVKAVLYRTPGAPDRVAGLAVSSQAPALIALDHKGQVLRPALIWMDRRAEAEAQQLKESLGFDRIFQITGNRPDPYFLAAKALWFKNHELHLLAQTHRFVQVNGYINYRLTGLYAVDPTHAALMQLWHRDSGEWSAEMCEACGINLAQLPACCPSHQVLGEVTASAAQATGLRPGTPVMVGMIDAVAAALEAGVTDIGTAAEMTGTSTVLMIPNKSGITKSSLIAIPHVVPNTHLLVGAIVASGASLNWYREQFGLIEQQASTLLDADVFDLLSRSSYHRGDFRCPAFDIYRALHQMQQLGLLVDIDIALKKTNLDAVLLYDWLSDGEQEFLGRMALFHLLADQDDALVILDEPETHFNDILETTHCRHH